MDTQLLVINTRIPPRPSGLVNRPRLVEAIESGLDGGRLVLVSAPAGFGKTTLLIDWAHATHRRVAWLTVEPEQSEPELLLRYLTTAWRTVDPAVGDAAASLLLEPSGPDIDLAARALMNYAARAPLPVTFVLDDVHLLRDPVACKSLSFLIEHFPPGFEMILASRTEPALPLSRWRGRGWLCELGASELAFRIDETRQLLANALDGAVDEERVATVQAMTEGWAAALRFSARSAADDARAPQRDRAIGAYLSDEVLASVDAVTHRFLVQVSVLGRLAGPLCDAVTGGVSSRAILERLERQNLFLQALDADRAWYRLHPLFAEVLRRELAAAGDLDAPEHHARAAQWFFEQAMPNEAFRHAVAAGDAHLTARIAEAYVVIKLECGEFRTVQEWIEAVPDDWYAAAPELNILRLALPIFSGDFEAGIAIMEGVETALPLRANGSAVRLSAKFAVVRCAIACFRDQLPEAEAYAARALRDLDAEDVVFRSNALHALADTYRRHGRWDDAMQHYRQVLALKQDPGFPVRSAHVYGAIADLELRRGRLHEAARFWQADIAAIQRQQNWGKLPVPIIGWAYIRYGELLYEWNALDDAARELERGLERAELGGDAQAMVAGFLLASQLRLAAGDLDAATDALNRAQALWAHASYPEWQSKLDRTRALLFVHQGDAAAARKWCRRAIASPELASRPENQEAYLGLAHLMIVFGDAGDRATAGEIIAEQLVRAETEGRGRLQIEGLALLAMVRRAEGNDAEALIALDRALRLAEPEGPIRVFLDLGAPVAELLHLADRRGMLSPYGAQVRAAGLRPGTRASSQLIEPLSERELEILRLAAAGLTNRETGERLYISAETVKTHLGNVYGKLGVHRRVEAAARARELGLLH
jgi:LuxR family maltose regulon positive regulatory protein